MNDPTLYSLKRKTLILSLCFASSCCIITVAHAKWQCGNDTSANACTFFLAIYISFCDWCPVKRYLATWLWQYRTKTVAPMIAKDPKHTKTVSDESHQWWNSRHFIQSNMFNEFCLEMSIRISICDSKTKFWGATLHNQLYSHTLWSLSGSGLHTTPYYQKSLNLPTDFFWQLTNRHRIYIKLKWKEPRLRLCNLKLQITGYQLSYETAFFKIDYHSEDKCAAPKNHNDNLMTVERILCGHTHAFLPHVWLLQNADA